MKAVSSQTMRELDRATIAAGTSGETLMERAGAGAFGELCQFSETLPRGHRQSLTVLAGKGNNGGDGHVVARLAAEAGWPVRLASVCPLEDLTGDARATAERLPENVAFRVVKETLPTNFLVPGTVVVDALLGTGISGDLKPPYPAWIARVNDSGLPVVALDIPSGLNGDTGELAGDGIVADLTVAMGLPKIGFFRGVGPQHCGRLRCVDIGLPATLVEQAEAEMEVVVAADIAPLLRRRPADGHKGTFGRVLTVGGSARYTGAPWLAAEAALRVGCGLSTVAVPASVAPFIGRECKALIVHPIPDDGKGVFGPAGVAPLSASANAWQAIVVGPGIGRSASVAHVVGEIVGWPGAKVFDADALRMLAANPALLAGLRGAAVLTPHPGEMRALLEGFALAHLAQASRAAQAVGLAQSTGCAIVLKGRGTVIATADGRMALNTSGGNALATAGTGDVLAGLIGGLLAQGLEPWDAARAGVFIHGLAGEIGEAGDRSLIADDLPWLIGPAMRTISPLA